MQKSKNVIKKGVDKLKTLWYYICGTKRIIALVLVAIMAVATLVACTETAPETTAPKTEAPKSEAPATTPGGEETTEAKPTEETPEPTESDVPPVIDDPFIKFGGMDAMYTSGAIYGGGYECWPFDGNGDWAPRAFFQLCVTLGKEDGDFTENIQVPADYKWTFQLYFADADEDLATAKWDGPYTCSQETFYDWGDKVIYRLQTSDAPEGDPCAKLELGKAYSVIVQVKEGEESLGFWMITLNWDDRRNAEYNVFKEYWTTHNRADGYAAADQPALSDADKAVAEKWGFTYNENGGIEFVGA